MIHLDGRDLRVCLLDTNVVSMLLKDPDGVPKRLLEAVGDDVALGLSVFSIVEVSRQPDLYDRLIPWLAARPVVVLKPIHLLVQAEVDAYPDPSKVDPVLVCPFALEAAPGLSQVDTLRGILQHPTVLQQIEEMAAKRQPIVSHLVALTANYPAPAAGYSQTDIRRFAAYVTIERVVAAHPDWARRLGSAPETDAFPSLKAAAYCAFYKFYSDAKRKARASDTLDLGIASALPYAEIAVLEADQANIVRHRVARTDPFLQHVRVLSVRELS